MSKEKTLGDKAWEILYKYEAEASKDWNSDDKCKVKSDSGCRHDHSETGEKYPAVHLIECLLSEKGWGETGMDKTQAKFIADSVCDEAGVRRLAKLEFRSRVDVSRTAGVYSAVHRRVRIYLSADGDTVSTLLHELAHHLNYEIDSARDCAGDHERPWQRWFAWAADFEMSGRGREARRIKKAPPIPVFRTGPLDRQAALF